MLKNTATSLKSDVNDLKSQVENKECELTAAVVEMSDVIQKSNNTEKELKKSQQTVSNFEKNFEKMEALQDENIQLRIRETDLERKIHL